MSDADNNVVRLLRTRNTETVNGHTSENLTVTDLGVAFNHPTGPAADGEVTTVASKVSEPMGLCWHDGAVYVADTDNSAIRTIRDGQVTSTFKRYVAPEIVNEIIKEGSETLELGGKLTDIAVLFVDVRGFTTMSEQLMPQQVVEILNRYFTLISDCILKNGGTLDKVVGNIGSPQRMDYTAIGDTVNTAARLEGRLRVSSLGDSIKLKGKAEGFEVLIMEEIL